MGYASKIKASFHITLESSNDDQAELAALAAGSVFSTELLPAVVIYVRSTTLARSRVAPDRPSSSSPNSVKRAYEQMEGRELGVWANVSAAPLAAPRMTGSESGSHKVLCCHGDREQPTYFNPTTLELGALRKGREVGLRHIFHEAQDRKPMHAQGVKALGCFRIVSPEDPRPANIGLLDPCRGI